MNVTKQMEPYIYKRTKEGVHYLDLAKTWEKAMVAARIIAAVQDKNPKDVLVSIVYIGDGKSLDKTPNAPMCAINQSVTHACVLLGCLIKTVCPARRAQVCHSHQRQLPWWKVGTRNID